jgi:ribosomal protein L37AE/L43A
MAEETIAEKVVRTGHHIKIASDPLEANSTDLLECPNCHNGVKTRKAGMVDHCHYCGYVFDRHNK